MGCDRIKYERLIAESPLFSLDRERDGSAFRRDAYQMAEYLYRYLLAINRGRHEPCGCEIMETAMRCIRRFDPEKGDFLHYFNAAWKKEYARLSGARAIEEKFHGLKITEEDKRNIRKYLKLVERLGISRSRREVYGRIAEAMGLSMREVEDIAQMADVTVVGDASQTDGGETAGAVGQIPSEISWEEQLLSDDAVPELLLRIEEAFAGLQSRQKPVIADVLTARIWTDLPDRYRATGRLSFISEDVVAAYRRTGVMPTQRDIAAKYRRDEASVSRTAKKFYEKVKYR